MKTEADLQNAAEGGLLAERHYLDIKRQIDPGAKANRELARDLASFAVDGGDLVIGVDEDTSPPALTAVSLAGLSERIEQVGLSLVDEPLNVRTQEIAAASDPGKGYLIVNVAPSPRAPHMVDHVYYARDDKTKYRLSDPEVARLHERRKRWERDALELLGGFIWDDPTDADHRKLAHLFLVAEPVAASSDLFVPVLSSAGWSDDLNAIITRQLGRQIPRFVPDWDYLHHPTRRAHGAAWTSDGFEPDGRASSNTAEEYLIEVTFTEGGGVRMFSGHGSGTTRGGSPRPGETEALQLINDYLVIGWTYRVTSMAQAISQVTGFTGMWDFAVGLTGLRGAQSLALNSVLGRKPAYSAPDYRESIRASLLELEASPHVVVDRLLGRLLRGIGSRSFRPVDIVLSPPGPATEKAGPEPA